MGRGINCLSLQILLQKFARITHRICRQGVEIVLAKTGQGVYGWHDQLEGLHFGISFCYLFLKNYESLWNELISLIFQLGDILEHIYWLDGL